MRTQIKSTNRGEYRYIFFVFVISLALTLQVQGQSTTVFIDDFSTPSITTGGSPEVEYTVVSTINPVDCQINSGILRISNGGTTNGGKTYLSAPLADYHSLFRNVLKNNIADVTWTFNFRTMKSGQNSFVINPSNHAVAIILAASNSNFTDENNTGYAVVFNHSNAKVKLVKFSHGFGSDDGIETIIGPSSENTNTSYASYKVIYSPSSDTWRLFYRIDGTTAFKDPALEDETLGYMTAVGTPISDNTYTSNVMSNFGFLQNFGGISNATNTRVLFDNYKVSVAAAAQSIDASLSDLQVSLDGINFKTLTTFNADTKTYQYYLTKGHAIPTVSAIKNDPAALEPVIVPATNLRGTQAERTTTITVTAEDESVIETYSIEFIETENIYQSGMGDANGTTVGGGSAEYIPEGWTHSNMYFSGVVADGNNKFDGRAAVRQGTTSTLATLTLPPMSAIGTLKFFARKYEEGVVGNIKVLMQKDEGEWLEISNLGDIESLTYQEFIIPINQVATTSMLVSIEVTKNGDTFSSRGYFFDDFSYTAPDFGTSTEVTKGNNFIIRNLTNGISIDTESALVAIYNATGMLLQQVKVEGSRAFNNLNSGIYIICVTDKNGSRTVKHLID